MPFGGQLSRGCHNCRRLKVKCDEVKPTCSRCSRSRQVCRYRDELDLQFRNQTDVAVKRAQEKWRSRATKPLADDGDERGDDPGGIDTSTNTMAAESSQHAAETIPQTASDDISSITYAASTSFAYSILPDYRQNPLQAPSMLRPVSPRLEQIAVGRFFSDYVVDTHASNPEQGWNDLLPDMFGRSSSDSCLHVSVIANSLANLAGRQSLPELKDSAAAKYCQALELTNAALQNPEEATRDETLLAVSLLGLYEVITGVERTQNSWATHIDGAILLLRLRGEEQFEQLTGIKLYRMVHTQMVVKCLSTRQRPPLPMVERIGLSAHGYQLMELMHQTADLRGDIYEVELPLAIDRPDKTRILNRLMMRSIEIESRFEEWSRNQSGFWLYQVHDVRHYAFSRWSQVVTNLPDAPTKVHTYETISTACHWNMYRSTRILLNLTIIDCVKWMSTLGSSAAQDRISVSVLPSHDSQHAELYDHSTYVIHEMIDDICSSVSSHLDNAIDDQLYSDITGDPRAIRGYCLLWPLCVVLVATNSSTEAQPFMSVGGRRLWVKNVLEYIHRVMGIGHAAVLANRFFPGQE